MISFKHKKFVINFRKMLFSFSFIFFSQFTSIQKDFSFSRFPLEFITKAHKTHYE